MTSAFNFLAKKAVVTVLGSDPRLAIKLRRIAESGVLTVLNLHRVDDRRVSAYEAIRPHLFDSLVGWLKRHFSIVIFGELETRAAGGKPPLVLSFDDGYKDFIETVAPILEKHGVRANQNVIPGCVESGLPPTNVLVQDFIGQAPAALLREVALPGLPEGADPDNRVVSGLLASAALKSRPIAEQKTVLARLAPQFARYDGFSPTPLMSVAEIAEAGTAHEIGTHSFEHATMTAETDAYVAADAARCRDWHRVRLGAEPLVYAFPNGSTGCGHVDVVRAAGYRHVLLTGEGFSARGAHVHPRFTMHGASAAELRFRATGAMAATRPAPNAV
jgi:peptidoglycan/xylan/chitin deacetylase (PgdA/CDA1 family)